KSTADDGEATRAVAALLSAYGGADTWTSMRGVEYRYQLTLYGPDGSARPATSQVHRLSLDPGLWLEMEEILPGGTSPRVITLDGETLKVARAGVTEPTPDDADFRRAIGVAIRWEFRLPWTLLDHEAVVTSRGVRTPAAAGPVPAGPCDVIRLRFDAATPGSSTDDWHDLYVSRRSHLVEQVHTYRAAANDYRLTVWSDHRDFGGLRVATKRRTYGSDASAAVSALQAEAEYSDVRFETLPPAGAPE
ncbi:MAG TPA: hypothetical protein VJV75_10085, partial [Candidatus Polarisedimenticolia bacterium]|nr:hypothetical protein [Candidatus Polarisedimenticolia bacterium]